MKQEIEQEKTKERMEYIARTIVCVLESVDEFLETQGFSDIEKMDAKGILVCEMVREMAKSTIGLKNLPHVIADMKNSIRNSPVGETRGTMQ